MADKEAPTTPAAPVEQEAPAGPSKSALKKRQKEEEKAKKQAEKAAKQEELMKQQAAAEVDFAIEHYGKLPLNQSGARPKKTYTAISSLSSVPENSPVLIRARVHTKRLQGNKMVFIQLRQRIDTVQALLTVTEGKISKQMVKWAGGLGDESIVLIEGVTTKPPEAIKSATVSDVEVHVDQIFLVSGLEARLPFSVDDAQRPETEAEAADAQFNRVLLDTRLNNRVVDLRTTTNQAIFKLQAVISDSFRKYLESKGFLEIHTPKMQAAATESGASVFKVSYFKGSAFLAQSPQLAKQMCIAADFERVYEIGPVFRAENSFTHRHLTEFMGLDLEMAIEEHYHEVMETLDELFLSIFRTLREKYKTEIETVRKQFPADEFKWREGPEGTLRLTFKEAVDLLAEDGVPGLDDINTENEKRLGRIVKAKYDTDYFIIDKFPLELRPFYTMPDANDPKLSNSYDFFMRGEEILSGAQRIHDSKLLTEKMREKEIDPESMRSYLDAFRLGATLFPRDPKRLEP